MAKDWAYDFYHSKQWQQARAGYIARQNGLCERCRKPGKIVHHRKHLRPCDMDNPQRTLSYKNLELLCQECHNQEHLCKTDSVARIHFDEDGNISPLFASF